MRRSTRRTTLMSAGAAMVLAGSLTSTGAATAAQLSRADVREVYADAEMITGPLQNKDKTTYLGVKGTSWYDTVTTPGAVTYPAPGHRGIVSLDGTCVPVAQSGTAGALSTIPLGDGSGCLQFFAEITAEGYFTFKVDHEGAPANGHYLGDGSRGGVQDLIATEPDVLYAIPEEPAGTAKLDAALHDVNENGRTDAGDEIVWTASLDNTGNVRLRDLDLTLSNGVSIACDPAMVDAGQSIECASEPQVLSQEDIDAGKAKATLTAKGVTPRSEAFAFEDANKSVALPAAAEGTTSTTVTGTPEVGEDLTVTVAATNAGNVTLSDMVVELNGEPLSLDSDELAPGATVEQDITHTITQKQFDAGKVSFRTTATGSAPSGESVTLTGSDARVEFDRRGAISSTLEPVVEDGERPGVGEQVGLRLRVTNDGNITVDELSGAVEGRKGMTVSCGSPVAPGKTVACDVDGRHTVTQADVDAGEIAFRSTITGSDAAGDTLTTTADTVQRTVEQAPAVTATLTSNLADTGEMTMAGDHVAVTLTVKNTGNVTLTDITSSVTGLQVTCPAGTLAPGKTATCTVTEHVLTQADIESGKVDFAAAVTATGPKGQAAQADATAGVEIVRSAAITAVLTAHLSESEHEVPQEGDTVTASVVVENTGNVNVSGLVAELPELADMQVTCPSSEIAPGKSAACGITEYTLTQSDLDAGQVTVVVVVTGTGAETPVDAKDSVRVGLTAKSALALTGTVVTEDENGAVLPVTDTDVFQPGAVLNVSYRVVNTGNLQVNRLEHADGMRALVCAARELAPGEQTDCTMATGHEVTDADARTGQVELVGKVQGVVTRADGESVVESDSTTGQTGITVTTGGPERTGAEQTGPEQTGTEQQADGVRVVSDEIRNTVQTEPTPVEELAFTGTTISQVALPAGIVAFLAGLVLLMAARRRRQRPTE